VAGGSDSLLSGVLELFRDVFRRPFGARVALDFLTGGFARTSALHPRLISVGPLGRKNSEFLLDLQGRSKNSIRI
jgi:hypothetical protein